MQESNVCYAVLFILLVIIDIQLCVIYVLLKERSGYAQKRTLSQRIFR